MQTLYIALRVALKFLLVIWNALLKALSAIKKGKKTIDQNCDYARLIWGAYMILFGKDKMLTLLTSLPTSPWQVNCIAVPTGNCLSGVSKFSFRSLTRGISITVGLTEMHVKKLVINVVWHLLLMFDCHNNERTLLKPICSVFTKMDIFKQ